MGARLPLVVAKLLNSTFVAKMEIESWAFYARPSFKASAAHSAPKYLLFKQLLQLPQG